MFGRHKLMRDGAQARAVVTGAKRTGGKVGEGGMTPIQYDLELKVHVDDGSTSDASCHVGSAFKTAGVSFFEGDIVPVRYDQRDRAKVVVDEPAMKARQDADLQAKRPAQAQAGLDERIAVGQAWLHEGVNTSPLGGYPPLLGSGDTDGPGRR